MPVNVIAAKFELNVGVLCDMSQKVQGVRKPSKQTMQRSIHTWHR